MINSRTTISKRILTVLLAVAVAVGFTVTMPSIANAAGTNPTNAEGISFNKDVYDTAPESDDGYHYYKFKTDKLSGVSYTAKSVATGSTGIDAYILDSNYEKVVSIGGYYKNFGVSAGNGDSLKFNLAKNQVYYVRVNSWSYYKTAPYMIRIQKNISKPGKPVIDYLKAGKKKFTIKYYKAKYATKYQIRYKKQGANWSKAKNAGKKLKYVRKGLKSGKKYSVQVRAIRTVNGKNYVGKWSKTRTVKVK